MAVVDQLTKVSLVLAHLPSDQFSQVLRQLAPRQRQAVQRRLESFTRQELIGSGAVLREFVAAIRRFDAPESSFPAAPHAPQVGTGSGLTGREIKANVASPPLAAPGDSAAAAAAAETLTPEEFADLEQMHPYDFLSILRDEEPAIIAAVVGEMSPGYQQQLMMAMPAALRDRVLTWLNQHSQRGTLSSRARQVMTQRVSKAAHGAAQLTSRQMGDFFASASAATTAAATTAAGTTAPAPAARPSARMTAEPMVELTSESTGEAPREIPTAAAPAASVTAPSPTRQAAGTDLATRLHSSPRFRHDPGVDAFNAVAHISPSKVRQLIDQVPLAELAVAFIGAPHMVKEKLLTHMLPDERVRLQENLRMLGPVSQERTDRQRARVARRFRQILS